MQPLPNPLPSAGASRRLAALIYDGFLLFGVLFIATLPAVFLKPAQAVDTGDQLHELTPAAQGLGFQLYILLVIVLFYSLFWRKNGQTLGMQAWRLQLQAADGGRPDWLNCAGRVLAALAPLLLGAWLWQWGAAYSRWILLPIGLLATSSYWWIWLDRDGLSWLDRVTGTRVWVLPKKN